MADLPQLGATFSALPNEEGLSTMDGEDTEDDDMEWEEVDVMQDVAPSTLQTQDVEVILEGAAEKTKSVIASETFDYSNMNYRKRRNPTDRLDRILRLESHKLHTITLLASFTHRNKWLNDPLLHVSHSH